MKHVEIDEQQLDELRGKYLQPCRRKLPNTRPSVTVRFQHGGMKGYATVSFYPDTHQPGEVFVAVAKEGSFVGAAIDQIARQISFMLQHGITAQWICQHLRHHVAEPMAELPNGERGSLFDSLALAIEEACATYGAALDCDHLGRR